MGLKRLRKNLVLKSRSILNPLEKVWFSRNLRIGGDRTRINGAKVPSWELFAYFQPFVQPGITYKLPTIGKHLHDIEAVLDSAELS